MGNAVFRGKALEHAVFKKVPLIIVFSDGFWPLEAMPVSCTLLQKIDDLIQFWHGFGIILA